MKKIFAAAIVLVATYSANAQVTATASATATIVSPISITKNTDMNFGNISVSAALGGIVSLDASQFPTRQTNAGSGITFPANTGTITSAEFQVNGEANYSYSISLPASAVLVNGANTMNISAFYSDIATGQLDGTGTQIFYVGGDLDVNAGQAPGVYTTATDFSVSVNY